MLLKRLVGVWDHLGILQIFYPSPSSTKVSVRVHRSNSEGTEEGRLWSEVYADKGLPSQEKLLLASCLDWRLLCSSSWGRRLCLFSH